MSDLDLDRELAELPAPDVGARRRERARLRAHRALANAGRSRRGGIYRRVVEPALVIGLACVQLAWLVGTLLELLG